jgi:Ras-related protein Rab-8A
MLLVFDVGSEKTFKSIEHWMKQIDDHTNTTGRDSLPPKVVLVGNKCDLPESQRQVTKERAEAMAKKWGVPYIEASAKDNINVQDAFMTVTKLVAPDLSPNSTDRPTATLTDVGSDTKKGCAC